MTEITINTELLEPEEILELLALKKKAETPPAVAKLFPFTGVTVGHCLTNVTISGLERDVIAHMLAHYQTAYWKVMERLDELRPDDWKPEGNRACRPSLDWEGYRHRITFNLYLHDQQNAPRWEYARPGDWEIVVKEMRGNVRKGMFGLDLEGACESWTPCI